MAIFLYCVQHQHENNVTKSYCDRHDNRMSFGGDSYWSLNYHIRNICETTNVGPKGTVEEIILAQKTIEALSQKNIALEPIKTTETLSENNSIPEPQE